MKNKVIVAGGLLVVVFLIGFLPEYIRANRFESELQQTRQENSFAALRDLAALAYIQAAQKNYGLAAETASRFFNRTREVASQAPANHRKDLEDLLTVRDRITSELAKGDPGVVTDMQDLYLKTRQLTAAATAP